MPHASESAEKIRLNGTSFNMPKPAKIKQCGENEVEKQYLYIVTGFEPILKEKNLTEIEFMRELKAAYTFGCICEYDCCGCYSQSANARMQDGAIHLTVFGTVNY